MSVDLFMIDPPWQKKKGGLRKARPNQQRNLDYQTLSTPEIFTLLDEEVFAQATPQHTVFLWQIDEFFHEAEAEMRSRGYRLHARMIWDKLNGVAPAFSIRYSHEYLTWWYKPKFTPVCPPQRGKWRTVFSEPARQHSRKPEIAYQFIESCFPDLVKMDVFSRAARPGWLQYGDQLDYFAENPVE